LFLHEGSSGTLAWGDPKTGVIGLLFLQYRDKNDSDARLRKQFREAVEAVQSASAEATAGNAVANSRPGGERGTLPVFWKSRLSDIEAAAKDVKKGQVQVLAKSAGARNIYLVAYGAKQDRHSTANYKQSHLAAGEASPPHARAAGSHARGLLE
jgi:hypothetical protein